MQPGRLKFRVMFQKKSNEKDEFGQSVEKWTDVVPLWASITDQTGKEFNSSQTEQSITNCTITIRKYKDIVIASDMRAYHDGIYYDIKAVLTNEKQTHLHLPCQKGVRYD